MFPVALSTYLNIGTNSVRPPESSLVGGIGFSSPDKGRVWEGFGISLYLSFINTPKPATGKLETFFKFTFCISSSGVGSNPETSTGGVVSVDVVVLLLPNGRKFAKKFVSSVPSTVCSSG